MHFCAKGNKGRRNSSRALHLGVNAAFTESFVIVRRCSPASHSNYCKSNLASFSERQVKKEVKKGKEFAAGSLSLGAHHVAALSSDRLDPRERHVAHRRVIIVDGSNCSQELGSSLSSTYREARVNSANSLARMLAPRITEFARVEPTSSRRATDACISITHSRKHPHHESACREICTRFAPNP